MKGEVAPLDAGEIDRVTGPTDAERFWAKIPLLGVSIASAMWTGRYLPIRRRFFAQLESRPESVLGAWDDEIQSFASEVCRIAQAEMGWPNARFVPEDPYRVVFWSFDDGLDLECAMQEIAERFGIPDFDVHDVERWLEGDLGTFVAEQFKRRNTHQ